MSRNGTDWMESTRNVRFLVYGFLVLMAAATFAVQGKWLLAAKVALGGTASFAVLWWFIHSVRRTPTLDVEESVRKVGARERP